MGAELAGALLGFSLIGFWIDRYYGTRPWGLLVCAILGLVGGLYNFIRSSMKTFAAEGSRSAADAEDSGEGKARPR
jgi:ATP synthase protein I